MIYSQLMGRRVEALITKRPRGKVVGIAADPNGFTLLTLDDGGEMNEWPAVSCRVLPDEPWQKDVPMPAPPGVER